LSGVIRLPEIEYRILAALEAGKALSVEEMNRKIDDEMQTPLAQLEKHRREDLGLPPSPDTDQSLVMAGATLLAQRGLVKIDEERYEEFSLPHPDEEVELAGGTRELLPERKALREIGKKPDGVVNIAELPRLLGESDVRSHVKWLLKKGWCSRQGDVLVLTDAGREAARGSKGPEPDEYLLRHLLDNGPQTDEQLRIELGHVGIDLKTASDLLKGRDDLVKRKKRTRRTLSLTEAGKQLKDSGIESAIEVNQLAPELLASGKWRDVVFRKYDPALATAPKYPGKEHPLQRVIQEIRQAFFEMGFEEVTSPTVDTAFWVFDALFQPQDHPAREMQDTFYVAEPKYGRLPGDPVAGHDPKSQEDFGHVPDLVQRVARTHENGGDTGSTGWRYKWDIEKARQLVLRTHTTSASIRALAANPKPPRKVFCIGKTFRREATDQTHQAEFMQIDGIIIDEQATLATLFGTLEAFYKKMGAEEVRFRPSFFPYTEPSAEVFAKMGKLGWVEMCGSGVFRPEVTQPLGCEAPVLAWGGGVERIAMLRYGLEDIRKLYMADIDWLRQARLSG
jgi:phenylalanyl-tRNA synthetase alpha chain